MDGWMGAIGEAAKTIIQEDTNTRHGSKGKLNLTDFVLNFDIPLLSNAEKQAICRLFRGHIR